MPEMPSTTESIGRRSSASTSTVNNPNVIGREARHGGLDKFQPPKKTMRHAEAKNLILTLYRWWLDQQSLPAPSNSDEET